MSSHVDCSSNYGSDSLQNRGSKQFKKVLLANLKKLQCSGEQAETSGRQQLVLAATEILGELKT